MSTVELPLVAALIGGFLAILGLLSLLSALGVWVLSRDIAEPDDVVDLRERIRPHVRDGGAVSRALLARVLFVGSGLALTIGLGRALVAGNADLAVAWAVALLWLVAAAVADHRAARLGRELADTRLLRDYMESEADRLGSLNVEFMADRDEARALLRRAHIRLDSRDLPWQDLRVNEGQPL